MGLTSIMQFILAIPKIWAMFKEIELRFKQAAQKRKELSREAARSKLEGAEGEDAEKEAARDYLRNH